MTVGLGGFVIVILGGTGRSGRGLRGSGRGLVLTELTVGARHLVLDLTVTAEHTWWHRRIPAFQTREPPFQLMTQTAERGERIQALAQIAIASHQHVVCQQIEHSRVLGGQSAPLRQDLGKRHFAGPIRIFVLASFVDRVASNETQVNRQGLEKQITVGARAHHGFDPLPHDERTPGQRGDQAAPHSKEPSGQPRSYHGFPARSKGSRARGNPHDSSTIVDSGWLCPARQL